MSDDRCGTCRFWDRSDPTVGTCRRYPPGSQEMRSTHETAWCGEYQPRSQVHDHRDEWEKGPRQNTEPAVDHALYEIEQSHGQAIRRAIGSNRVEAGSGEEGCARWRAISKHEATRGWGGVLVLGDASLARCIFRRGHDGRCAFSVDDS